MVGGPDWRPAGGCGEAEIARRLRRKFAIPEENEVPSLSQRQQTDD
jgi:hypothetical protein